MPRSDCAVRAVCSWHSLSTFVPKVSFPMERLGTSSRASGCQLGGENEPAKSIRMPSALFDIKLHSYWTIIDENVSINFKFT